MTMSKDGLGGNCVFLRPILLYQSQLSKHVKHDVLRFVGNVILSVTKNQHLVSNYLISTEWQLDLDFILQLPIVFLAINWQHVFVLSAFHFDDHQAPFCF